MVNFKNNKMDGIGVFVFSNKHEILDKNRNLKYFKKDEIKNIIKFNKNKANYKLYETIDKTAKYKYSLFREKKNFFKLNFEVNDREYFFYQGEFKDNKFHGYGDIYFRNKFIFSGILENDLITDDGEFMIDLFK